MSVKMLNMIVFALIASLVSLKTNASTLDIAPEAERLMKKAVAKYAKTIAIENNYSGNGCSTQDKFMLIDRTAGTDGSYSTYLYTKSGMCGWQVESVTWKFVIREEDQSFRDPFVFHVIGIERDQCVPEYLQ